jgi:hypothetical protein
MLLLERYVRADGKAVFREKQKKYHRQTAEPFHGFLSLRSVLILTIEHVTELFTPGA